MARSAQASPITAQAAREYAEETCRSWERCRLTWSSSQLKTFWSPHRALSAVEAFWTGRCRSKIRCRRDEPGQVAYDVRRCRRPGRWAPVQFDALRALC
jgi:hypothetical protein